MIKLVEKSDINGNPFIEIKYYDYDAQYFSEFHFLNNPTSLKKFNIDFINDTDDIKLIKNILDYIDIFKKQIINPYSDNHMINSLIDNFLHDYNYRCHSKKDDAYYNDDHIYDEYLKIKSINYIDYGLEVFLINTVFISDKLFNIPLLYSIFYEHFYLKMTRNKLNDIIKNIIDIKKNNDNQHGCSILLKTDYKYIIKNNELALGLAFG
jgi:hypothetical protein